MLGFEDTGDQGDEGQLADSSALAALGSSESELPQRLFSERAMTHIEAPVPRRKDGRPTEISTENR